LGAEPIDGSSKRRWKIYRFQVVLKFRPFPKLPVKGLYSANAILLSLKDVNIRLEHWKD